ncbi:Lrp/AsnC family transcriptional regulator [Aestuariispira insulae]|uniref:AsnC family transcriptional regulator n=1 Tax=Aestuariispira insulae TaxID=1461337 RepID=A0A3D9HXH7_9PROT|nr:Lrp/AsnC family transcriptional regulator [Aestuariispira insulae]RED54212.1 AsnC family transcriptional regulator [Aestuariispira insulae]
MAGLDGTDRKIIAELSANARLPVTKLAARVGLSRTAVQLRIDRMERDGMIRGYRVELAESAIEKPKPTGAFIEIRLKERMKYAPIVAVMKKIPEVRECHNVSGDGDLILVVEQATPERIQEICEHLWNHPNVQSTNTIFVLSSPISPV